MGALLLGYAGGLLGWTALEYALHRGLGHNKGMRNAFSREHTQHHKNHQYFTPLRKKLGWAAPLFALTLALGLLVEGVAAGAALVSGLLTGWMFYEIVHLRLHTNRPIGPYGRWVRRHHFYHHFHDPRVNHGVTSPMWDLLLGSYVTPGRIRVPKRFVDALPWMLDENGRDVDPRYARDYTVTT